MNQEKYCGGCGTVKPVSGFAKCASKKDGLQSQCKDCRKLYRDWWYSMNPNYDKARYAKLSSEEKKAQYERVSFWAKQNKAKHSKAVASWAAANLDRRRAGYSKRRASKRNATPRWANHFFIREAYALAETRTKMLGFTWEVDHIVPLVSSLVCGLHVEHNLQVIPAAENRRKSNSYWPDMP